jgi:hypothetical protein
MSDARVRAAARLAEELGFRVFDCTPFTSYWQRVSKGAVTTEDADEQYVALWNALVSRELALGEADRLAGRIDQMHDSGFWVEGVDSESFHRKDAVALRLALARYRAARGRKA